MDILSKYRTNEGTTPLFRAVDEDDLEKLKSLLKCNGGSVNAVNVLGKSLLFTAAEQGRLRIFDYLLSFDNINIDCCYRRKQQIFSFTIECQPSLDEASYHKGRSILTCIRRGTNVLKSDYNGVTFLHLGAQYFSGDRLIFGQLVIEKGVDVNAQNYRGLTPLHVACSKGNSDWVYMLLYYGANPAIADHSAELPLVSVSMNLPTDEQFDLQTVLFQHTFDGDKTTIQLATLVRAMTYNTPLFWTVLEIAGGVDYDVNQLELMVDCLYNFQPHYFKEFIKRFGNIVREMIEQFPLLEAMFQSPYMHAFNRRFNAPFDAKKVIQVFLESDLADDFIQTVDPSFPTIAHFIDFMYEYKVPDKTQKEDEEVTKMVCSMLTHGLPVTCKDLNAVYERYGFCELFKILLHMDIDTTNDEAYRKKMISLYYDPSTDVTDLSEISLPCGVLEYYNHPKIKEVFRNSGDEEKAAKAESLPSVPLLLELSRNVARKYIMSRYNIKTCRQFYTVLNWLPIGGVNQSIIALEKKLY